MRTSPLPVYFRQSVPQGRTFFKLTETLDDLKLHTVCEEAKCPNRTDCYARGTLTFQILGAVCTRRCGFCAEETGRPVKVDLSEPERIVNAAKKLALRHIVITAPARDDLSDGGAAAFCSTIQLLKQHLPQTTVEILISDLNGNESALTQVLETGPDVFNHNIETVERLTPKVRAKATYQKSLQVLKFAAQYQSKLKTKSGLMVGLGETIGEIERALDDLRNSAVQYLTVGHYLPPSASHLPLARYFSLEEFKRIEERAYALGFEQVFSGPLIRSSYHADEMISCKP